MSMNSIKVESVSFRYSKESVIENLSFEMKKGDFVGILGPNGSGKTTLIRLLLGFLKPEKGKISIFGKNVFKARELIGYVPQKLDIDRSFPGTVREMLELVKSKSGNEIINLMEINQLFDQKFVELSGGQQQRVITAMSLLKEPEILILDEPSSGIDVKGQTKFNDLLSRLNAEKGVTVLLISHDVNLVSKYAKKALCVNKGHYCFGATKELPKFIKETFGKDYKFYPHYHGDSH